MDAADEKMIFLTFCMNLNNLYSNSCLKDEKESETRNELYRNPADIC